MPCCDATHNYVVNSVSSQREYTYTVKVDNHELPHKQDTIFSLNEFNQIIIYNKLSITAIVF